MPRYNAENPSEIDIYIAQQMRRARLMQGLSQEVLADGCGISFQAIQKYERGETRVTVSRLYDIAKSLGCPVLSLLPPADGVPELSAIAPKFRNNAVSAEFLGLVSHLTHQQRSVLLQIANSFVAANSNDAGRPEAESPTNA